MKPKARHALLQNFTPDGVARRGRKKGQRICRLALKWLAGLACQTCQSPATAQSRRQAQGAPCAPAELYPRRRDASGAQKKTTSLPARVQMVGRSGMPDLPTQKQKKKNFDSSFFSFGSAGLARQPCQSPATAQSRRLGCCSVCPTKERHWRKRRTERGARRLRSCFPSRARPRSGASEVARKQMQNLARREEARQKGKKNETRWGEVAEE